MSEITTEQLLGQTDNHITWLSKTIGIHTDIVEPFTAMQNAALADGIELTIASGFRSFDRQLTIWNKKVNGTLAIKNSANELITIESLDSNELINAILLYSALPGASRHHWGTDIDVYSPAQLDTDQALQLEVWEYQTGGPFEQLTAWLKQHAKQYGFFFPYDVYRGGVAEEPWHLSYQPLANKFHPQLTAECLKTALSTSDILLKDNVLMQLEIILKQYVFNINDQAI